MVYLFLVLMILGISISLILPLIPEFFNKEDREEPQLQEENKDISDSFDFKVTKMFLTLTEEEEKELQYVSVKKGLNVSTRLPLKIKVKLYLNKLFNTPFSAFSFVHVVVMVIVMWVIALGVSITLTSLVLFLPLSILLGTLPIIHYIYRTYKNELKIMESNFFLCNSHYNKYVSSSTFIDSIRVTRNSFLSTSREYNILNQVYNALVLNNLPIDLAVDLWAKLMVADSSIKNYLTIIIKCESNFPEYKNAMRLILERSRDIRSLKTKQLEVYSMFLMLSNFAIIVSVFILYYLRWFSVGGINVFSSALGNSIIALCYFAQVGCVLFVLVTNSPLEIDPTGMPSKIRKRTVEDR